ncbi:MRG/MORF4L-binding protein [Frankliniella fusca]|uniref:MRG/MORF4L-binding protein n=1 Tax=Frankliniella fusca TaxID=407009 RepID=A0AAE1LSK3_9NEOP|nr:MRG/MORF4L-binding protein [Frankliniella fusca]
MATEEDCPSKISVNNNIEWNVYNEVKLLLALMGHKPVGVAKHFHMACILEKFSEAVKRDDISSQVIWDRLETMYDLQALEENEALPFPKETVDFSLPPSEYGSLLAHKKSVKMPPPPAPSPPPDIKKEDSKDIKKEVNKETSIKKELKDSSKKDEKKINVRELKKDLREDTKKDKRITKELVEIKKEKEMPKGKEIAGKDVRLPKRASVIRDDEDSSVSSTGSTKRSRDNSDDDAVSTPKRGAASGVNNQSANGKGKRQTRYSHAKVSDDSGSNKSISPLTVPPPGTKRRSRHM